MLQKGQSVLWKASSGGYTEIVLLLLRHHAVVDLPNDVRHSNTMYTIAIDTYTCYSHKLLVIDSRMPMMSSLITHL